MSTYTEKLKDPRWQKKRLEILERDGFTCKLCGNTKETLNVHHWEYVKGEPWDAPDYLLATLCTTCHEGEKDRKKLEIGLIDQLRASGFSSRNLFLLAEALSLDPADVNAPTVVDLIFWILDQNSPRLEVFSQLLESIRNDESDSVSQALFSERRKSPAAE
jgi:hypothetical protein